jgi:hypothetical protein
MNRLLAIALATSLLLVAGPVASSSASVPTLPATTRSCSGVWVVVDRGNGDATTRCATSYGSGLTALRSAGFSVELDKATSTGFVTRIHAFPTVVDATSFTDYWSYWHASVRADGTFSAWSYSSQGAGSYHPTRGSVEGWRFGAGGSIAPNRMPPRGYSATPRPVISGKAKVGRKLRVRIGAWQPTPQRVRVRWYRSGKLIAGATNTGYRLRAADRRARISVRVTVSSPSLQTVTRASAATRRVHR